MAMLAEPRRKQKVINLRAKNNAWSNDNTKWGQRMLEKMGWKSGKGLGAKENGIVEHVVAKYKNDDRGLGFEDRNDQWTKHEDDFNSLLANLSNGDTKEEKLHSGVSLEVKSKTSKARVHYHKYTRGKDLTRYSEKDLANIFGKKTLKLKSEEKVTEELQDDVKTTEVVFTEKGSMEDYFKSKLAAMKFKPQVALSKNCDVQEDADYSFCGFSGTGNEVDEIDERSTVAFQGFSFYGTKSKDNTSEPAEISEDIISKKSKKKKKSKRVVETNENHENQLSHNIEEIGNPQHIPEEKSDQGKTNMKKNKHKTENEFETTEETPKRRKSKNKNDKHNEVIIEHIDEIVHVPKKKKKRKNKVIA